MIVANFLHNKPISFEDSIFSLILPCNSCAFANRPSIVSYCFKNFWAVFSPTPGIPGILSAASPIIPKKSIT